MQVVSKSISTAMVWMLMLMAHAESRLPVTADGDPPAAGERFVRLLDDVNLGGRWVLRRDTVHPAGPGRLVRQQGAVKVEAEKDGARVKPVTVIHSGDRVIVEEKTKAVDVRLQGVALAFGAKGDVVKVKLTAGGWLVLGIVEAQGRVRLVGEGR